MRCTIFIFCSKSFVSSFLKKNSLILISSFITTMTHYLYYICIPLIILYTRLGFFFKNATEINVSLSILSSLSATLKTWSRLVLQVIRYAGPRRYVQSLIHQVQISESCLKDFFSMPFMCRQPAGRPLGWPGKDCSAFRLMCPEKNRKR